MFRALRRCLGSRALARPGAGRLCAGVVLACGLAACGAHHKAPVHASICDSRARTALAEAVGIRPAQVLARAGVSSQSVPECTFVARTSAGRPLRVQVAVEITRQAYFLVTRSAVEASQIFGPTRFETAPQQIDGLGIVADWFPDQEHLLATDGARLVTTTVTFPAEAAGRRVTLAVAMTRPYLGRNVKPPINGV